MNNERVLVCGAGGFIGGHLVKRLKEEGYWVRGADIKPHDFSTSAADEFILGDLRDQNFARSVVEGIATAAAVADLAARLGIELPITEAVDGVLHRGVAIDMMIEALLSRPYRSE